MPSNKPPLYSGKYQVRELQAVQGINLLRWSEQCVDPVWTKNNIVIATDTLGSPEATTVADKIYGTLNSVGANISQTVNRLPFNTNYTFSTFLKPAGFNYAALTIEALSSTSGGSQSVGKFTTIIDLSTGLVTDTITTLSAFYNKQYTIQVFESIPTSILANSQLDTWSSASYVANISSGPVANIANGFNIGTVVGNNGATGQFRVSRETLTPEEQQLLNTTSTFYARLSVNGTYGTTPLHQFLGNDGNFLAIGTTPTNVYPGLAGKTVTTSFWARASQPTKIFSESQVHRSGGSVGMWTPTQQEVFDLTTQWQKFTHTRVLPTTAQVAQVAYDPNTVDVNTPTPVYTPLTATGQLPPVSAWVDQIDIKTQWSLGLSRRAGNSATRPSGYPGTAMSEATLQQITDSAITNGYYDIALIRFEVGDSDFLEKDWIRFSVTGNPYIGEIENTFTSLVTCAIKTTITPLSARTDTPTTERNGNEDSGLYVWGSQLNIGDQPYEYIPTTSSQDGKVFKAGGQAGNLIYYSQDFTVDGSEGWTKTNINVVANAETSPRGLKEASKITETTGTGKHQLRHEKSRPNNGQYTASIYAKKAERRYLQMSLEGSTTPAIFDLETGTVTQTGDFQDPYIERINGGWYRCSVTYEKRPDDFIMSFGVSNNPTGNASYTGVLNNGIYVWGAQVERTAWAGEYTKTEGAPFTRFSHYDFSNQDVVEPSLTMPYNFNHLYWSDVFNDTRTTWAYSNGARTVSTTTPVPLSVRNPDSSNLCSQLVEGTTSSLDGFRMAQTHEIRHEWDVSYDGRYTFSIYVKRGTRNFVRLDLDALSVTDVFLGRVSLVADLLNGVITQPAEGVGMAFIPSGKIENIGDGWHRISLTGFFGEPDNRVVTFDNEYLQTFLSEDILQFQQVLKDFDIKGIKQIRPRIVISNGPGFGDIQYTGNNSGHIFIWGAQLEAGPIATKYTTNTTGKTRSYDGTLTRVKPDTVYYFPIIRFARSEETLAFQVDATYDRTRRTTGNDTLILYNNKIGYKNTNPTFNLDISGSLRSTVATLPTLSTDSLRGTTLNITDDNVVINSNISLRPLSGNLTVTSLSAFDVVTSTNVSFFSSLKIPINVTAEEFENLPIDVDILTENFFVTDFLSSGRITARASLSGTTLNARAIDVSGNFLPLQGRVNSNISPKNILYFTENLNTFTYWATGEAGITPNATTAPNGTNTADKLIELAGSNWPRLLRNEQFVTSEKTYVYSVHAKAAERRYLGLDIRETTITLSPEQFITPRISMVVDLQDGTIVSPLTATTASQAISASVIPVGNAWYRIAIVFRPNITPKEPNDPSSIRIRHSILNDITPTTLLRFNTVINPPLPGARDIDSVGMRYTGTAGNGLFLWGTQLEFNNVLTNYERNEQIILPDIYTNNVIGKVPIDPSLTNPVMYTPQDELRVDRNVNLVYGIKPSDSFSSDSPTLIRALTGDWDKDHNAHELGVFKPFFKNWWGVVDYIRTQGLFGNSLTVYIYEDILGNSTPINLSQWPTNHPYYNLSATTPADVSGLRAQGTAGYTRLARRWGGGVEFECDVYTTEWLGANYPALTAAGLRGGTYTWRDGNYTNRNLTNLWIPGRAFEVRRDINFPLITVQGLHDILPRVGFAAVSATIPTEQANDFIGNPNGYSLVSPPVYKNYYIKDKPYDQPSPKFVMRSYICSDRLANFSDGRTNTTNGGGGFFGSGTGNPDLFTKSQLMLADTGAWSFDRAHLAIFDMRPSTRMHIKNLIVEQVHNCTDATPILWAYGNLRLSNVTTANQGNAQYYHWGSGVYEEGYWSKPDGINTYNGEYQIDPYYLTPQTWNSQQWRNVIGAKSKAYYPGYGIAIVGSWPRTVSPGLTTQPWDPTPSYAWFTSPFEHTASSYYTDEDTKGRQFGRGSHLQGSIILDGHWCTQPGNVIANMWSKRSQSTILTDGYIFKGDNFLWNNYDIEHVQENRSIVTPNDTRVLTTRHNQDPNRRRVNFYPTRGGSGLVNLFTTSVGVAPWTFNNPVIPTAIPAKGTALYFRSYINGNAVTWGTWDDRWFVLQPSTTNPSTSVVDFTGYLTPQFWYNQQTTFQWTITIPSESTTAIIPNDGPNLLNYGTTSSSAPYNSINTGWKRYELTVDGYRIPPTSFKVSAASRIIDASSWRLALGNVYDGSADGGAGSLTNLLTALDTHTFFINTSGVTTIQIPPGMKLPSSNSSIKVTRTLPSGQTNRTKTTTVLTPGTQYTINPATRVITFTQPIPVNRVTNTTQLSGRTAFNCDTEIDIEVLAFAQGSVLQLQLFPADSEAYTPNIINSIVQQSPYWLRTNDNRLILSGYGSPNQLDNYRNWFTINGPIDNAPRTLVYYTTASRR
jgi:hypothetical protein